MILLSEIESTINEIILILRKRKVLDEYSICETCTKLYQLLLYYFDSEKPEKVRLKACKIAITDLIPHV